MSAAEPQVRAAGAVLHRRGPDGAIEVAVVHRPRYDDWSLPKGKLDDGESFEQAALREIREETGFAGVLGADLGEVRYTDHRGRPKVVRWWAVAAGAGAFTVNDEVDELRWVGMPAAFELVDYDTDRSVLSRFAARMTT